MTYGAVSIMTQMKMALLDAGIHGSYDTPPNFYDVYNGDALVVRVPESEDGRRYGGWILRGTLRPTEIARMSGSHSLDPIVREGLLSTEPPGPIPDGIIKKKGNNWVCYDPKMQIWIVIRDFGIVYLSAIT